LQTGLLKIELISIPVLLEFKKKSGHHTLSPLEMNDNIKTDTALAGSVNTRSSFGTKYLKVVLLTNGSRIAILLSVCLSI
jgi:hypothetical protein